jgi:hypothetical protein
MTEVWKPVLGWEELYEASDIGRVRSLDRVTGGPFGSTRKTKGRILRPSKVKGYWHVCLKDKQRVKNEYVHRLVLLAFVGEPGPDQQGCHGDGDRLNNALSNLRWDTLAANKLDMIKHGTSTRGESNPQAKLTADQIRAIRADRGFGLGYEEIAKKYGISSSHSHAVCSRTVWKHL